jgi:AAA15 family ATPase/GTPase
MIDRIEIKNMGPLTNCQWTKLGSINLVIGNNGSGKTFLLKAIYTALRTLEDYKRGNDLRSASDILADKLYWTFQPNKIGDLVSKGADKPLSYLMTIEGRDFSYSFGKDTSRNIGHLENHVESRTSKSIFLPAKEVLSLHQVILKSREQDQVFGFDDTYLDLARALQQPTTQGKIFPEFRQSRDKLESILGGTVEYKESSKQWFFKKGRHRFPIGATAEGIKKIAILDTLLGNRYLSPESIVLIDEPESALHPTAIAEFLDILAILASRGIQIFLATHSYFTIKKLFLIAQQQQISIPVLMATAQGWVSDDLRNGMPDNPIVNESIRLYKEEVELAFQ